MASRPVRIGVIVVGFGSTVHIPGFLSEGAEVVAVCARRSERAEDAARQFNIPGVYTDYRALLDHPGLDAVSVVTPNNLHYEITMAALEAGKHVGTRTLSRPNASNSPVIKVPWFRNTRQSATSAAFAPGKSRMSHSANEISMGWRPSIASRMAMASPGKPARVASRVERSARVMTTLTGVPACSVGHFRVAAACSSGFS